MLVKYLSKIFWSLVFITVFSVIAQSEFNKPTHCPNVKTSLGSIRKRRHLAFPDGSSLVIPSDTVVSNYFRTEIRVRVVLSRANYVSVLPPKKTTIPDQLTCSTVKTFMTHVPSGWYFVMELDLVYPLPNHNFTSSHLRKKLHHRQKRELWDKLRIGLEQHNLKGQACILRSVCEAQQYLAPPGRSLVHDLLRAVFTAPLDDEDFVEEMRSSYSELMEPDSCDQQIDCPFSPVLFILSLNKQKY